MKILLISDAYPPEIRSISYMVKELAEELSLMGHDVWVATCWPRYNLSSDVKEVKFSAFLVENGVKVIRIKTLPHHKVNFLIRGLAQLNLPCIFFRKIRKFIKEKIDVVMVYSPPLPLAIVGMMVKRRYRAKFVLNIQDIFPQNAIDLGLLKNRVIIRLFERMERKAYSNADKITSHTENSRRFLIKKRGIPEYKIITVHNWIDIDTYKKAKATGEFRKKYNLKDKFIFLFPGILGPSQNLEFIINVAKRVKDIPHICFLFVGDGQEKTKLERLVREEGLQNVQLQPFVPQQSYPFLVKEADVGLVNLSSKNRTPVIPGKILGFMAASIPVLAFLNEESDGHDIIEQAQCGYSMLSEDEEKAADVVRRLLEERDRLATYGRNGYDYAVRYFSKEFCISRLKDFIQS